MGECANYQFIQWQREFSPVHCHCCGVWRWACHVVISSLFPPFLFFFERARPSRRAPLREVFRHGNVFCKQWRPFCEQTSVHTVNQPSTVSWRKSELINLSANVRFPLALIYAVPIQACPTLRLYILPFVLKYHFHIYCCWSFISALAFFVPSISTSFN